MRHLPVLVLGLLCSFGGAAFGFDVTSEEGRKQTLVQYIQTRDDLSDADKAEWDKAVRFSFGGKALKGGGDEALTAAKSVLSAGIFFGQPPKKVAAAAYDAHNDVLSWVPPPVAIEYQLLKLQGRPPKESPRLIAFNFPKYFNEELAPEFVSWWDAMLASGALYADMVPRVERQLVETRLLMRPMLASRLYRLAELEAKLDAVSESRPASDPLVKELKEQSVMIRTEIGRDFKKVGNTPVVGDPKAASYDRYAALMKELKQPVKAKPAFTREPKPTAPPVAPTVVPTAPAVPLQPPKPLTTLPPVEKPAEPDRPTEKPAEKPTEKPKATPEKPVVEKKPTQPPKDPVVPAEPAVVEPPAPSGRPLPAPVAGDPLVPVYSGYERVVTKSVDGWIGTPYLLGGVSKKGIDCSAFVREVFRESQRVELPRTSIEQASTGVGIAAEALKNGDMVFFDILERGRISHVGVFLGENQFAHASSSRGVTRDKFNARWVQRAFRGSRRILDLK